MPIGYDLPQAGGSTINALNDINDVNVPSPANQDVIYFDSSLGKWIAGPISGLISGLIPSSISDLADVAPDPGLSAGQILWYNGSVWTNTNALTTDGDIAIAQGYQYDPLASNPHGTDHGTWVNSADDKIYYDESPLRKEENTDNYVFGGPSGQPSYSFTLSGVPTAPSKAVVKVNGIPLSWSAGEFTIAGNTLTLYPAQMGYDLSVGYLVEVAWF